MVETLDIFDEEIMKGNLIGDTLESANDISIKRDTDNVIGEVKADMYSISGVSDIIRGDTDNRVLKPTGINDSIMDIREICDTAKVNDTVVESDVMERFHVKNTTSQVRQNKSCLLESHL